MEKDLSFTELVVLLSEELLNKTTPVRGTGKSNIDPLRETPQHCIVQVLRKLDTLDLFVLMNIFEHAYRATNRP